MRVRSSFILSFLLAGCGYSASDSQAVTSEPQVLAGIQGEALAKNKAGDPYPSQYEGEGGKANVSVADGCGRDGGPCIRFQVTQGTLYAQFNAHNADGTRGFAREYVARPTAWKFNAYNRMAFWMKTPPNGGPMAYDGTGSVELGTYSKRIANADEHSDETGGGHWYHIFNLPNTNTWTRIIVNTHPHHFRGNEGGTEEGNQPHPTDEPGYGYMDVLTRFYVNETHKAAGPAPIVYDFDDFEFYQERNQENDEQIYSIAGTYLPDEGKFILTWSRNKDENTVKQEVRYSDKDIHAIGWAAAKPAPNGVVTPPGFQGYNGMTYSAILKDVKGPVYFAIKPQNSKLFSQIRLDGAPQ